MADFLYIHIPFCVKKCLYCNFVSVPYNQGLAEKYINSLCRELNLRRDSAGSLKSVYIGGGTPSLLPADALEQLFGCLCDNFAVLPGAEITIEANPGTMDEKKIELLISLGVNRISVGIQSLHDDELRRLGRTHNSAEAVRAVQLLKAAGLKNYSVDLMYGIPGQTMTNWKETLAGITELEPHHISAYELTPEKNTPLYRLISSGDILVPDEDLVIDMYNHAIDFLAANGYGHYEISNFAFAGFRSAHNLNYWNRGEYIGAGAAAHSFIAGLRSSNPEDIGEYREFTERGIMCSFKTVRPGNEEAAREFIFLGLRKMDGIRTADAEKFGLNLYGAWRTLVEDGYLETDGDCIRLTRKGLPVSNSIFLKMYEELGL